MVGTVYCSLFTTVFIMFTPTNFLSVPQTYVKPSAGSLGFNQKYLLNTRCMSGTVSGVRALVVDSTESHSCPSGSSIVVGLKQKINRSNNENVEDIDKIGSAGGWRRVQS